MTTDSTGRMTLDMLLISVKRALIDAKQYGAGDWSNLTDAIDAHLTPRPVTDGWEYHEKGPKEGGDQRCICTIETDGMVYVGIAIWTANSHAWFQNGSPLTGHVLAWKPLPEPAKGRWARGKLIGASDAALESYAQRGGVAGVKEVYVCSNPKCCTVFATDPMGHCPACIEPSGVGFSTMRKDVK